MCNSWVEHFHLSSWRQKGKTKGHIKDIGHYEEIGVKVKWMMLLPACEVPGGGEAVTGETLAVTAVVALVHLTLAAGVLRQAAALLGAVLAQETGPLVEAVALAAPYTHAQTTIRLQPTRLQQGERTRSTAGVPKIYQGQTLTGCVSIHGLHPSKGTFKGQLRHNATPIYRNLKDTSSEHYFCPI